MQFKRLAQLEESVLADSNQKFDTKPFSIPSENQDTQLQGYTLRPSSGFTGYFYDEQIKKEKIVLHFTAGHLKGDLLSLTSKDRGHVSVPYVIARDGKIFQLFSADAWSYHLGRGAKGGNTVQSKKSIGIEISNFGPLTLKDGKLETIYSRLNGGSKHIYCSEEDTDQYIKLDKPFRGYKYFASYTDEQYDALITLLRHLTDKFEIPRAFFPEEERYQATMKAAEFKGILSHVNFRETGKTDIGPAFDWERVIKGVKAENFSNGPVFHMTIDTAKAELQKAKEELQKAEQKVKDIEDRIQSLESNTTRGSRGGRSTTNNNIMTSEAEVNKFLEGTPTRGGRGRGRSSEEEPKEDSLETMSNYYI